MKKPESSARPSTQPATGGGKSRSQGTKEGSGKVSTSDRTAAPGENRSGGGNSGSTREVNNSGNTKNVNNSKTVNNTTVNNVNVNVNRSTVVVANPRPYPRPPYAYGGHAYYAYHPYHYHPYKPYYYGPAYNPWGFFVATLAVTAVAITVASQQYHYDQGVYYVASNGGYTVVQAPVGATVTTLPPGTQTVVINETTNNYYYGGTYYEKSGDKYTVVPPTAGSVVETLPPGGEEVKMGEVTYVKVGETYYQPITKDGKEMYEVVEVKAEK